MFDDQMQRRGFLKTAVAGVAGAALGMPAAAQIGAAPNATARAPDPLKLGVASYSLRKFPRDKAIEMVKALHTPYINIKSFHLPYELSPAATEAAAREFEKEGLKIVGGGTITFEKNTDEEVRKYFEYAKHAHLPLMVVTGPTDIWPRVERFAKQYDIKVAIHNHGPEDKRYPAPADALKYIRNMDRRMGLCVDIGHTVRTGTDVVKAIADAGPRVLDIHVKDLRNLSDKDSQCIVGEGAMPIADIFRQLKAMNYQGYVNLEYEIHENDPLPGMKQSFAHMRGVLAGLNGGGAGKRSRRQVSRD
jgi:sugar phosphate isomerase/epimerase